MPTASQLRTLARQMKDAQDTGRQIAPFTSFLGDFDVSSAYEVAHLIHQARVQEGSVPVGRKIGFTNPDMWSIYGVREPIWAYVYDTTVVHLGGEHQPCSIGRFTEPEIEPEIVLHFHSAPPSDGGLTEMLACIDWIAHGFEIVQSHFPGWNFQAADTIADWALHGMLLVGESQAVDRLGADLVASLERFSLELSCNGEPREVGKGSNVLGSPLAAVAHLTSVLAKQPLYQPLQADELVTTGTITTAHSLHAGETWRTVLRGIALPGLSLEVTL